MRNPVYLHMTHSTNMEQVLIPFSTLKMKIVSTKQTLFILHIIGQTITYA